MSAHESTRLRDSVITLAGVLILLGIARYASAIVVPLLLSFFITIIAASPINWLKDRGVPALLAIGIILFSIIVLIVLLAIMLGNTMVQFNDALPVYQAKLNQLTESVTELLAEKGINLETAGILNALDPGAIMAFANTLMVGLADVLGNAVMIMFTTMFLLIDMFDFPQKLQSAQREGSKRILGQISLFMKSTNQYLFIKALISLGTGVLIWLCLEFVGLDFAVLWGVIAFVLNFVPNIGSFLAAVPAVLIGIVQLGPTSALVVIAIYAVVNTVMGNLVEPKLMGKKLGLSILAVFLSLVFWGWLFGSVGMLLSVPLTMAVKFAAMNNPQTRWLGILLSPPPEDESEDAENKKADNEHGGSGDEKLSSELTQLRLELEELKKGRDADT